MHCLVVEEQEISLAASWQTACFKENSLAVNRIECCLR